MSSDAFRSFVIEKSPLAIDAPGIAGRRAIVANDTVAGDRDRESVGRTGSGHSTHRLRRTDAPRKLGIGHSRTDGNVPKRLPQTLLERRAAHIQGKIETNSRRFDEAHDPRYQDLVLAIGADEMRLGKAVLKSAHELVRIISEEDGRNAFPARRHQNGAQRGLPDREPDLLVRSARAIARRRHAEHAG